MYLYKDGNVVYCDGDQVEQFLEDGWSKDEPKEEDASDGSDSADLKKTAPKKILRVKE